jgi:hypothetical protein
MYNYPNGRVVWAVRTPASFVYKTKSLRHPGNLPVGVNKMYNYPNGPVV